MPLRFAHTSDIHLLDLQGVAPWRYFNKRITGRLNLALRRGKKHDSSLFDRATAKAHALGAERLVVTGDLTNLSLESEFALVRRKLDALPMPATVIPGNHDTYTRGAVADGRCEQFLGHHMDGQREPGHAYPFVQRFDGVALVGLNTGIATPPFRAVGKLGDGQLARLATVLATLRQEGRSRVVLIHHPVMAGESGDHKRLLDLDAFGAVIAEHGAELVLHGHEHRRIDGTLPGPEGDAVVHGIASGTSLSEDSGRRASFSLYDADASSIRRTIYQWNGSEFISDETSELRVAWAA
ncbi:MAG: metallophosphoesterase [Nannocystaceae bacterium]|nr:metallophosphoesterase [Nannocystaceae bacterium]